MARGHPAWLDSVDLPLLGGLLMGSVPGIWWGSRMAVAVPGKVLGSDTRQPQHSLSNVVNLQLPLRP